MSDKTIRVGDLVMVVRECCQTKNLGRIDTVIELWEAPIGRCSYCGVINGHRRIAIMPENSAPVAWLIKIDPPQIDESIEHKDEVTA